jgi:hypothetical protein
MLIQRIRDLVRADPFQPFQIRLTSGVTHDVKNRDFILIAPKGSWIDITDENDNGHFVSSLLIEEVIVPKGAGTPANGSAA